MLRFHLSMILVLSLGACSSAPAQTTFGSFIGTVKTEWLRGSESERRMLLLEDFAYIDLKGQKWLAPELMPKGEDAFCTAA